MWLRRATETVLPRRFCMAYPRCAWVGSQSRCPISVLATLVGNSCLTLEIRPAERHFDLVLDHDMIGTSGSDREFPKAGVVRGVHMLGSYAYINLVAHGSRGVRRSFTMTSSDPA